MNIALRPRAAVLPLLLGGAMLAMPACGDGAAATSTTNGAAGAAASAGRAGASGSAGKGTAGAGGVATAGSAGASGAASGGNKGGASQQAPGGPCVDDADCSLVGAETNPTGCAEPFCKMGTCAIRAVDADGDGFRTKKCKLVSDGVFVVELGADCDDARKDVNPKGWDGPVGEDKPNHCGDGVDQDCSGVDGDGVLTNGESCSCAPGDTEKCGQTPSGAPVDYPGGQPAPGSECKLGDRTCVADLLSGGGKWGPCIGAVGPSLEVCSAGSAKDEDCDGEADEADADGKQEYVYDADGDGARASLPNMDAAKARVPFAPVIACAKPTGTPKECTPAYCGSKPLGECCPPGNWRLANTATRLDCDDFDNAVFPGAPEVCAVAVGPLAKDKDDNCNGLFDELPAIGAEIWFYDGDNDGSGDINTAPKPSCAAPGPLWKTGISNTDCDDSNASIRPGVAEDCTTTFDDNCNGSTTDGCACTVDSSPEDCGRAGDCVFIEKGSECLNGFYQQCPAAIEKEQYCPDKDGDGACVLDQCAQYCPNVKGTGGPLAPPSFRKRELCAPLSDCDDESATVRPGVAEICGDGIDQDCKLGADDGCGSCTPGQPVACYSGDLAATFFGNSSICKMGTSTCGPTGVPGPTCSGEVLPASAEACNGLDDNCNGQTDEGFQLGEPCDVKDTDRGACKGGGRIACVPGGGSACKALDLNIGQSAFRSDSAPSSPPSWDWDCSGGPDEREWTYINDYTASCSPDDSDAMCAKFKNEGACLSSPLTSRRRFCNWGAGLVPCGAEGHMLKCRWAAGICRPGGTVPIFMACR